MNSNLKSFNTGNSSSVTKVVNNLTTHVQLFWLTPEGKEIAYDIVQPNNWIPRESASISHAWRIKDLLGNVITEFYGDTSKVILNPGSVSFEYESNLNIPTVQLSANDYMHQTFGSGIINVAKALGVNYSEPDFIGGEISCNDNSSSLKYISSYNLWKQGFNGKGVTVAVVGSGIDPNCKEFAGRIIGGYDFGDNDSNPTPTTNPHETGITGILAGSSAPNTNSYDTVGVAPEVSILNIKNMRDNDSGGSDLTIAQSIRYAVDNGAKVISISQGNNDQHFSQLLFDAAKYAQDHNVAICISTGNGFKSELCGPAFSWVGLTNVIVVGNWEMSEFNLFKSSNTIGKYEIPYVVAPSSGWQVQLNNEYSYYHDGGTSSATPYVSGLAALLFQQHPDWIPNQVIKQITSTSTMPYSLDTQVKTVTETGSKVTMETGFTQSETPTVPVDNLPIGKLLIKGQPTINSPLTFTNTVTDSDGVSEFFYEWGNDEDTFGIGTSYVPDISDLGKSIYVTLNYIDGIGNFNQVKSENTFTITANTKPSKGNDLLIGTSKNDKISAFSGDDILIGGLGKDTLNGGDGLDIFRFENINESGITSSTRDTIVDFTKNDKIDLSTIDADTLTLEKQGFSFNTTGKFNSNATAQLYFDAKTHILYGSVDTDIQPEFSILLTGVKELTIDSFILS
jgi:subtilisin family serine protease